MIDSVVHGDAIETTSQLTPASIDAVVVDPPYGESMGYDGDSSILEAETILRDFLHTVEPKMRHNSHVAIFWTMRHLDVCIDALRDNGFTYRRTLSMYIPRGGARPYLGWLPRTQAIVIGQKYLPKHPRIIHGDIADYLNAAMTRVGLSRGDIARRLGCDSRLVMKWTRRNDPSWCLPTAEFYTQLKSLLNLDNTYDIMLSRESCSERSDFDYLHDTYIVEEVSDSKLHPSQKPLRVVEHVVSCVCPHGGVCLDAFAGSGTTAVACINTGRRFIAVESSCKHAGVARRRVRDARAAIE